jgi:iron complex outermembrane recepter protein
MTSRLATILSGASLLVLADVAYAQTDPEPASPVAPTVEAGAVEAGDEGEEGDILVTGSRIVRDGFESPNPLTVLGGETLAETNPHNVADALRQLPQLQGTRSSVAGDAGSSSAITVNAATGAYLDLRQLGPVRTLILQDGLRVPPNRADGVVDTNLLPQMLIDRVEVVTGGASAVYGSDAVAGVVNFKGIKALAQAGMSERSDYKNFRVGIAGGTSFLNDRVHIVASLEHYENEGLESLCSRPLGCANWGGGGVNGPAGVGTVSNPLTLYPYVGRIALAFGGKIVTGPASLLNQRFDASGNLVPFRLGTDIGGGYCIDCDGSNAIPSRVTLVPELKTTQAFSHIKADLSDSVTAWGQMSFGRVTSAQTATAEASQGTMTIFSGNAFLSPAIQAVLTAAGPNSFIRLGKQWPNMPNIQHQARLTSLNFAGGLRGEIADRFRWSLSGTIGKSETLVSGQENESAKLFAAIDAVRDPATGQIVCRIKLTNPGVQPNCVPLNPMGENVASAEALAYVRGAYTYKQEVKQRTLNFDVSGDLFSLWAGPISASVGAEYRELELEVVGNQDNNDITGVRFGNAATLKYVANNIFPAQGEYDVKEAYAELLVPLARDLPFAKALDVNGAVRFTDYSTSGSVQTWKIGATWEVIDDIRFRATRSRDIRAPTLNDLFAPLTVQLSGFFDHHTNLNSSVQLIGGGNPDLKPEKADTVTAGIVLSPRFIPGFTASIDWYRIRLRDAINQPFGLTEMSLRCEASNGTDPICAFIIRPLPFSDRSPANVATQVIVQQINVSRQVRSGVDVELSYQTELGGGQLGLRLLGNYQGTNTVQVAEGLAVDNVAGFVLGGGPSYPKLTGQALINYSINDWSLTLRERFVGSRRVDRLQVFAEPVMEPAWYTDLYVARKFDVSGGEMEAFLNVTNLFDKLPPLMPWQWITGLKYPSDLVAYDIVGRQFTVGVRAKF